MNAMKPQLINFNWTSVVMLLMLLMLMYILYKLLYKPFFHIADERRRKVEEDISSAERARKEAEDLRAQMEDELREARKTAEEIVSRARKEAEEIVNEAKDRAKEEAGRIIESAKKQAEVEKGKVLEEVRSKAGELAVALAMKILSGVLDEKAKREYLIRMIDKELKK